MYSQKLNVPRTIVFYKYQSKNVNSSNTKSSQEHENFIVYRLGIWKICFFQITKEMNYKKFLKRHLTNSLQTPKNRLTS